MQATVAHNIKRKLRPTWGQNIIMLTRLKFFAPNLLAASSPR